jgi:single-stranded DNA-specific DHH superfamily exonuclease
MPWPANQRLCIVADYDCDGATACAVAVRGLRLLGARHVDYLVPDRVVDGYGLTPPIARRVKERKAPTCSSPWTTALPALTAWPRPRRWA